MGRSTDIIFTENMTKYDVYEFERRRVRIIMAFVNVLIMLTSGIQSTIFIAESSVTLNIESITSDLMSAIGSFAISTEKSIK